MADDFEPQELDLTHSDVVTKYKAAAEICNKAIATVAAECKSGSRIVELCDRGDTLVGEMCGAVFKGKTIEKGIAFPTCLSVNNCVGHFSPAADCEAALQDGDVVKIDLGCHIDGFIAVQATTIVVGSESVAGRAADVIAAANTAFEAALRLIRPGKRVSDVSEVLAKTVDAYGCELVEGVISHQMKQFIIDGNKVVLNRPNPEARVEDAEFEENEVYAVDVVVSTGEGKSRVADEKETMIYKRALDMEYSLKMKASRALFSEINKRFPTMPFTMRAMDSKQSRFGLVECLGHGLLHPYPVLYEKSGELVAQVKGTVLLMPNGSDRITTAPLPVCETEKKVEDEAILELLKQSLKTKKKKKKKAAAAAAKETAASQ